MLDMNFIRNNPEAVKENIRKKNRNVKAWKSNCRSYVGIITVKIKKMKSYWMYPTGMIG